MDPDSLNYIIIIICSLLASAFFSGMEIAFISANRLKIELDKNKGSISGRILGRFVKYDANFIATMLLGNNIALVLYGIYMAKIIEPVLIEHVTDSGGVILLIQTIFSTLLILVTAEFLPKAIFSINPNRILRIGAIPLFITYWILLPITIFTMTLSRAILRIFNVSVENSQVAFSKTDLDHYVRDLNNRMEEEDDLGNEMQILQNALDFSNVKARDCMVPRTEIVAVNIEEDIDVLKSTFIDTGLSKILIYRDSIDNIIGYAHSFELFKNPTKITELLIPISYVPEAIPGKELLEQFTKQQGNISVVVDEFGGTSGVVTLEDVIEEIFGDIEDEHDLEELLEQKIDDRTFLFSGRLSIDDINEKHDLELPESSEYDTIGGLVINKLESIPEKGAVLTLDEIEITVQEVSDRRIELVRVELLD